MTLLSLTDDFHFVQRLVEPPHINESQWLKCVPNWNTDTDVRWYGIPSAKANLMHVHFCQTKLRHLSKCNQAAERETWNVPFSLVKHQTQNPGKSYRCTNFLPLDIVRDAVLGVLPTTIYSSCGLFNAFTHHKRNERLTKLEQKEIAYIYFSRFYR